jgi:hypothetical protein
MSNLGSHLRPPYVKSKEEAKMIYHDTESRLLLARERANMLAADMQPARRADAQFQFAAAADMRGCGSTRQLRRRRAVESRHAREAGGLSTGVRPA